MNPSFDNEDVAALNSIFSPFLEKIMHNADKGKKVTALINNDPSFQHFMRLWLGHEGDTVQSSEQPVMLSLFGGYFLQKAASLVDDPDLRLTILLNALDHYNTFGVQKEGAAETRYFAQWQKGLVQEAIGLEWPVVEETLLSASLIYQERGEAMKYVIQHYRATQEYGIAYMHSSIAVTQYFNKVPRHLLWFGDAQYYQWKVLNYHASLCSKVQNHIEAQETFAKLWQVYQDTPQLFTEQQAQTIFQNQKAFQA